MGLARELRRDFERWQERSHPRRVCLGRECSPVLTRGDVGGQSLAARPAPAGARDTEHFPLPPRWFSWLQNECSDWWLEEGIVDGFSRPVEVSRNRGQ